jgi:hypothetical protein
MRPKVRRIRYLASMIGGALGTYTGGHLPLAARSRMPFEETKAFQTNVNAAQFGRGGQLPPPTPNPVVTPNAGKYKDISESQRGDIRSVVMSHAAEDELAQKGFGRETVDRLVPGHEINKANITRRQTATTKAIQEHATLTGKSPQQFGEHDWAQIFNNKTLGLAAGGAGLGGLADQSPFQHREANDY